MKLLASALIGISIASTIATVWPIAPSQAAPAVVFACAKYEGRLATVVKTKKGPVPLVVWDTTIFSSSGYTPLSRCQTVTQRFRNFHSSGRLKYLTAGTVKNQPVICATVKSTESCNGKNLLFTLKPGADPETVLQKLNDIRNRAASGTVVEESAGGAPTNPSTAGSVDMDDWLQFTAN